MNLTENSSTNKLSIKNWAEEDRPREKLLNSGISSLSNAELVAILIGSGSRNKSAVELSKEILNSVNNNLNELGKLSIKNLITHNGIGEAKAISIIAALELGRRRKIAEILQKKKINGSVDVFELFQSIIGDLSTEEVWVLMLNQTNKIIGKFKVSSGGLTSTVIDVREIFRNALENKSCNIIMSHNHPSGNSKPSTEDIKITEKVKVAGKILDINLLDHVIIANNSYYSFADEGVL